MTIYLFIILGVVDFNCMPNKKQYCQAELKFSIHHLLIFEINVVLGAQLGPPNMQKPFQLFCDLTAEFLLIYLIVNSSHMKLEKETMTLH